MSTYEIDNLEGTYCGFRYKILEDRSTVCVWAESEKAKKALHPRHGSRYDGDDFRSVSANYPFSRLGVQRMLDEWLEAVG